MNILDAAQGSPAWHEHRATHFNASDAPAMLGLSPYKTRSELLRELATGITPEIDQATQRRFDDGHRFEALARPIAEKIIGEELFPVVGYEGKLSASFDGLTMDGSVCFEHKTLNAAYRDAIATGSPLPAALMVQIEQQMYLSQSDRCLFMASRWNDDDTLAEEVHCMVASDPELMAKVLKGWDQFQHDLENYQHAEVIATPVAASIEALPALMIQVEGRVVATNLDAFKEAAQTFIANIKTELVNDQDFANADKMVKFLKDGEERLALCKDQAQSQAKSIDELFRTIDAISEQMRVKRLALDKLVKAEKENRRAEIVRNASLALNQHVAKLNERIGGNWMPVWSMQIFNDAVKGLKSLDSMRDKVAGALATEKIASNEIADRIEANAKAITVDGANYNYLVHDFAQICTTPTDYFTAIMAQRIAAHKAAEAEKAEAAKKAEEARIAAAVEAERKAGEARAAAAIEAERMAEAKRVAEQAKNALKESIKADVLEADQRGKTDDTTHASTTPTPEQNRSAVVEAQDDISTFMASRDFGKDPSKIRAILVEFVKFQTERSINHLDNRKEA